jgi:hypothetical protein
MQEQWAGARPISPRRKLSSKRQISAIFSQYGQRDQVDRLEVKPPIEVDSATWSAAGQLDYWIKERNEWWGRVRDQDGHLTWIRAADLRRASAFDQ